jgi:hypothetical protein
VILLENSNVWNLFPAKRRILKEKKKKKKRSKDWKAKEVEPHMKKLHVSKKREWNLQAAERDSMKGKKKRRSHFPIVQIRCVASSIPTHHLHLHYLLFLDFSLSSPLSLHHSPSTMIICHTNSLEFSFASTIYKVYHRYLLRVNHHKKY